MTKKPCRLDGLKPLLKPLHHASQAMAGAHIPSVKYPMCPWDGPSSEEKFLTKIVFAHSQNLPPAKNNGRLGWIKTMAKILASCRIELGRRAQFTGIKLNGWNVL